MLYCNTEEVEKMKKLEEKKDRQWTCKKHNLTGDRKGGCWLCRKEKKKKETGGKNG